MKRREFIKTSGLASAALGSSVLAAPAVHAGSTINWKMVTSWPKNFPGLGTGANFLAKLIGEMSGGRLTVKVYGAKELVPALEVFDAVYDGTAEMGHSGAYYWKGKHEATQFFSAVPFGLTAQEMNGWLYHGGGLELWTELYDQFGLVPSAIGNTEGLKMRIPGLGGEVLKRAGGTPVNLPGGELFTALQSGTIDATEWVGPYNDLAFGFYKAAKHYYYPGWHEPGTTLEAIINKKALKSLPADLQVIVLNACRVANQDMLAEYTTRNNDALQTLVNKQKVDLRKFPDDVLSELKKLSDQVVEELADRDPFSGKVYQSFKAYRDKVVNYHKISEQAYMDARAKG
jgi:TRAP-type mannitol/chloroaromatic compound transport system substrate-binding protein